MKFTKFTHEFDQICDFFADIKNISISIEISIFR